MLVITVSRDDHDRRLDRVLRKAFPDVPPGALAGAVRRGAVRLNGKRCRNETRVQEGDLLKVPAWNMSDDALTPRTTASLQNGVIRAGTWAIPVLSRTTDRLALNKPVGLTTHGPDSLEEIVRSVSRSQGWWAESLSFRPGPVHRLDRNTSGVQLFALTTTGARTLSEELARRQTFKLYLAVLEGIVSREHEISVPLAYDHSRKIAVAHRGGARVNASPHDRTIQFAPALTRLVPVMVDKARRTTLVAAIPATGRTHQIRCHCAYLGHPLEKDGKYGGRRSGAGGSTDRYLLHALVLAMPRLDAFWNAPLPESAGQTLKERFGPLDAVQDRVGGLARAICTTGSGTDTIYL